MSLSATLLLLAAVLLAAAALLATVLLAAVFPTPLAAVLLLVLPFVLPVALSAATVAVAVTVAVASSSSSSLAVSTASVARLCNLMLLGGNKEAQHTVVNANNRCVCVRAAALCWYQECLQSLCWITALHSYSHSRSLCFGTIGAVR